MCAAAARLLSVVGCLHWQSVLVLEDLVACSLCDAIAASGTGPYFAVTATRVRDEPEH